MLEVSPLKLSTDLLKILCGCFLVGPLPSLLKLGCYPYFLWNFGVILCSFWPIFRSFSLKPLNRTHRHKTWENSQYHWPRQFSNNWEYWPVKNVFKVAELRIFSELSSFSDSNSFMTAGLEIIHISWLTKFILIETIFVTNRSLTTTVPLGANIFHEITAQI